MKWDRLLFAFLFFLLSTTLAAASTFISENALQSYRSTGRNLLQATKNCPVNFEIMNYTIITSKCKGPQYPVKLCCAAFQEFACPYAEQVNDLTNDCATTMFSYINIYGKYPPGLFSNECKGDKQGLSCDAVAPESASNANGAWSGQIVPHFSVLLIGLLVVLVQML